MLVLLLAVLGYTSVAWTLGYAVRTRNPVRAHALAPGDGRITALLAEKALTARAYTAPTLGPGRRTSADVTRDLRCFRARVAG